MRAAIVNVRSFSHPHLASIYSEGLWGFPDNKINRERWGALEPGDPVLLYGEHREVKGVWALCRLVGKKLAEKPVKYWKPPDAYPLLIRLECLLPSKLESPTDLDGIEPITRDELAFNFSIPVFRQKVDRWSLFVFGEKETSGVTYPLPEFEAVRMEFENRNAKRRGLDRPDHEQLKDVIYEIGRMQGRIVYKEYPIENGRLDVAWKKIAKEEAVPYIVWEISLSGDVFKDLAKLKHAYDLWNSKLVLVTTDEMLERIRVWVEGSFHEIKDQLRIVSWRRIKELYEKKSEVKRIEEELGIS